MFNKPKCPVCSSPMTEKRGIFKCEWCGIKVDTTKTSILKESVHVGRSDE